MKTLKIELNGKKVAITGLDHPQIVNTASVIHTRSEGKDIDILLSLHGSTFDDDVQKSFYWSEPYTKLQVGDIIEIEIVEGSDIDPPKEAK